MSDWFDEVERMDNEVYSTFGQFCEIEKRPVKVIRESVPQDEFGAMARNVTRLSILRSSGVKVKKGDAVFYKGKHRVIADVPDYSEDEITFELK